MWLVVCPSNDVSAHWAYHGLLQRGLAPLELVSSEILLSARCWEHRLDSRGATSEVLLADGRVIRSGSVRGVLNRLVAISPEQLVLNDPGDRAYAAREVAALLASWLSAVPGPVINRATPLGLGGQWRHLSAWLWLASLSGLPTPTYSESRYSSSGTLRAAGGALSSVPMKHVVVINGYLAGDPVPPEIGAACRRLGELAETALLGISFTVSVEGVWAFAGATPRPDLRLGGPELLDVLAAALRGEQGQD